MDDLHAVHVTFTCSHCGTANELTTAWVHHATVIHCSHCATAIAPLALLHDKPEVPAPTHSTELADA
jgi:peptide subunit release factor 1 (eRF1)